MTIRLFLIIIIAILGILLAACMITNKIGVNVDTFVNTKNEQFDPYINPELKPKCKVKSPLMKQTSLDYIDTLTTNRYPIVIDIPWNWYSTQ